MLLVAVRPSKDCRPWVGSQPAKQLAFSGLFAGADGFRNPSDLSANLRGRNVADRATNEDEAAEAASPLRPEPGWDPPRYRVTPELANEIVRDCKNLEAES